MTQDPRIQAAAKAALDRLGTFHAAQEWALQVAKDCIAAADAVGGWQDISTAPLDGTIVLVWYPGLGKPICSWYLTGINQWHLSREPTHWRHTPEPPTQQKEDE